MNKKIVQIAATTFKREGEYEDVVYALTDNGELWSIFPDSGNPEWKKLPMLPNHSEDQKTG